MLLRHPVNMRLLPEWAYSDAEWQTIIDKTIYIKDNDRYKYDNERYLQDKKNHEDEKLFSRLNML